MFEIETVAVELRIVSVLLYVAAKFWVIVTFSIPEVVITTPGSYRCSSISNASVTA